MGAIGRGGKSYVMLSGAKHLSGNTEAERLFATLRVTWLPLLVDNLYHSMTMPEQGAVARRGLRYGMDSPFEGALFLAGGL
jgi:hypothetical protein